MHGGGGVGVKAEFCCVGACLYFFSNIHFVCSGAVTKLLFMGHGVISVLTVRSGWVISDCGTWVFTFCSYCHISSLIAFRCSKSEVRELSYSYGPFIAFILTALF